jgi:hypothetical protein
MFNGVKTAFAGDEKTIGPVVETRLIMKVDEANDNQGKWRRRTMTNQSG